jgi:hypothetical protein
MQKFFLLVLFSFTVNIGFSQYEKGEITIGLSTNYSAIGSGPELFGFGIRTTKVKMPTGDYSGYSMEEFEIKTFGLNLAPNIGYVLSNDNVLGAEFNFIYGKTLKNDISYKEKQQFIGFSPYFRHYEPLSQYAQLYIEFNMGFGGMFIKNDDYGTSESNFLSGGISSGISLKAGDNISFDFAFNYDFYRETFWDNIFDEGYITKTSAMGFEFGIVATLAKGNRNRK